MMRSVRIMSKYNIDDRVYCINKENYRIDCGVIRQIIIDSERISYKLSLIGYNTFSSLIVEESLISKDYMELYQRIKDNITKYFPLMWR
jgi:hypothetical protein